MELGVWVAGGENLKDVLGQVWAALRVEGLTFFHFARIHQLQNGVDITSHAYPHKTCSGVLSLQVQIYIRLIT